jgi:hypothetical protein
MIHRTTFFPDPPDIRPIQLSQEERKIIGRRWLYFLKRAYCYEWEPPSGVRLRLTVPRLFRHDGASIPSFAWFALAPDGLIRSAALIHDWIYKNNGVLPARSVEGSMDGVTWRSIRDFTLTRKQADQIFLDVMLASGMNRSLAKTAHRFVRMFARRWKPGDPPRPDRTARLAHRLGLDDG